MRRSPLFVLLIPALLVALWCGQLCAGETNAFLAQQYYDTAENLRHFHGKYNLERIEIKLRAAIRLNPSLEDAHLALVKTLESLGQFVKAEAAIENWLRVLPNSPAADYFNLLYKLSKQKDNEKNRLDLLDGFVLRHAKESGQENPGSLYFALALRTTADELLRAKNFEKAIAKYTQALAARPGMLSIYFARARAKIALKKNAEALADLTAGLKLNTMSARGHWAAYQTLIDLDLPASAFQVITILDEKHKLSNTAELEIFGQLALRLNKYDVCEKAMNRALNNNPDATNLRLLRAIALIKKAEMKKAKTQLSVVEDDLKIAIRRANGNKKLTLLALREFCLFYIFFDTDRKKLAEAVAELKKHSDTAEIAEVWLHLSSTPPDIKSAKALLSKLSTSKKLAARLAVLKVGALSGNDVSAELLKLREEYSGTAYELPIENEIHRLKIALPMQNQQRIVKDPELSRQLKSLLEATAMKLPPLDKLIEIYLKIDNRELEYGQTLTMKFGIRNVSAMPLTIGDDASIEPHFALSCKMELQGKNSPYLKNYSMVDLPNHYLLTPGKKLEFEIEAKKGILSLYLDLHPTTAKEFKIHADVGDLQSNQLSFKYFSPLRSKNKKDWREVLVKAAIPQRILAVKVLSKIRSDIDYKILVTALPQQPAPVRAEIISSFGSALNDSANDAAIRALKDKDWYVRLNAIEAVATAEPDEQEAIETINMNALGDDDPLVRQSAQLYIKILKEKMIRLTP